MIRLSNPCNSTRKELYKSRSNLNVTQIKNNMTCSEYQRVKIPLSSHAPLNYLLPIRLLHTVYIQKRTFHYNRDMFGLSALNIPYLASWSTHRDMSKVRSAMHCESPLEIVTEITEVSDQSQIKLSSRTCLLTCIMVSQKF